jgi:nucleoside-diphosphate-sugar epimerase
MHALVTGANGFVGSWLCRKLVERGDAVRGLVRATSDLSLLEGVPIERAIGSLDDPASLAAAAQGIDVVFHVAAAVTDWGTLEWFRRVNVEGTRALIEAAIQSGVRRFVYVSTVAVHSFIDAQDMTEDSPQLPTPFPYSQSKREAEALVMGYHREGKIEASIVRPGDVYGPDDRVALLKLAPVLEAGMMAHIGSGEKLGAFAYVENLVDGIILAGTVEKAAGEAYVITDGVKLTWRAYWDRLTDALDLPRPRLSVPPFLARAVVAVLESAYRLFRITSRPPITRYLVDHMTNDVHFSIEKARRELGYAPQVGLDEAVARTAAWYRRTVRHPLPDPPPFDGGG